MSLRSCSSSISVLVWRDVLEVGRDHRVERLLDQALDVAEALHDQRRLHVVDVHHHRERQQRLEGVLGDQADLATGSRRA